jgi:hypothetical protein
MQYMQLTRLPIADFACRRYDHAYPYLMHHDNRLGDSSQRDFDFRSCSSAVAADVMYDQIPKLKGDQQVITLSAGRLHGRAHRQISLTHHFRW